MTIAAMKAALEALGRCTKYEQRDYDAMDALRAAISEQEKCEPVAWKDTMLTDHADGRKEHEPMLHGYKGWELLPDGTDLYAHLAPVPAEREPIKYGTEYESGCVDGWNACREAMLAAAPKPGEMK